jgi:Na+/glutamate symporter
MIFFTPVAIALAAAGTVGLVGGVIGALANWGIPADRAEEYEADIRKGAILMGVKTHSDSDTTYLKQQWRENGGRLIHS